MKTNFAQGADALADEIDSEEGVVTESAEAVREAARSLEVQWGNARLDDHGGNALRNCAKAIAALPITEQPAQEPIAMRRADKDVFAVAHLLALELECLLLDTKDTAIVSKWWDSSHAALEQWRKCANTEPAHPAEEVERLTAERDELLAALKEIAECAEGHPLYMPGATPKDVEREGGDAAFVTEDVAWRARRAISAIEQPVEDQTMTGYGHDIGCVPECGAA